MYRKRIQIYRSLDADDVIDWTNEFLSELAEYAVAEIAVATTPEGDGVRTTVLISYTDLGDTDA